MKATYYGHSCIALEHQGAAILFDPFISPNPAAAHIDISTLKPDHIFVSHCHQDHVADLAAIQTGSQAEVICIVEAGPWISKQGVPEEKITAMNLGGTVTGTFGSAKMVPALHTSSTPEGEYAGVPAGFLLTMGEQKLYFAGDTALSMEMQLLNGEAIDWAFLPIGGFFTMDVADALRAAKLINCKNIIGIHYDTFPPIRIDHNSAVELFRAEGFNLHLIPIGESLQLGR